MNYPRGTSKCWFPGFQLRKVSPWKRGSTPTTALRTPCLGPPQSWSGTASVAAFALRLVERASEPFKGLLLASAFVGALGLPDYDIINGSFFSAPFEWTGIRERMGRICRCWAGDDDPYVPLPRSQDVADHLQAPLEVIPKGGHLNSETGFDAFPQLRDAILVALAAGLVE